MNDKKELIFFDFDGVITDSFWAAFEVSKMIHPLLTEDVYRKRFEGNINESVAEEHIKKEHNPDIDFFEEYEPRFFKSHLFPGMKGVLERLAKEYAIVIISSTTTDLIKKYAQLQGIDNYFIEIMGNDVHKSKVKKFEMALGKYNADPKECFFVTDTLGDIKEARHVGVRAIAVSWGFQSRETLEQGRPFAIVDIPNHFAILTAKHMWVTLRSEFHGERSINVSTETYGQLKPGQMLTAAFIERKNGSVDHEVRSGDDIFLSW